MHSRQKITVPARGVSAFFAAVPAALSASVAETPGQTVLPLPRSADRQHPVCCHTSSADRIFRRRRLLSGQRQSVLCRGEYSALRPSAQRHPYLLPAFSDRHTVSAHPPTRQHIWILHTFPRISPTSFLNSPNITFLRYFGINTIWYVQLYRLCAKLLLSIWIYLRCF